MGEDALRRWAVLRRLHEEWAVPLTVLQAALPKVNNTIFIRAEKEGWAIKNAPRVMYERLIDVFEQHMQQFQQSMETHDFDQKATQSLLSLSKTLDAIVQMGHRIAEYEEEQRQYDKPSVEDIENKGASHDAQAAQQSADRTALLDQQLEALVQNLS